MADEEDPVTGWLKRAARNAGRRYGEIRQSYREGRDPPEDGESGDGSPGDGSTDSGAEYAGLPDADLAYLPRNENGDARIVCRRHAEKRAVEVDGAGRPECFDPEHPDCQGCVEDVRDGVVETW